MKTRAQIYQKKNIKMKTAEIYIINQAYFQTSQPFKQSDAQERADKAARAYRNQVVGKGHDYFGTPGDRDLEGWAFSSENVAGNPDHPNHKIYSQKLYSDGDLVGFTDPDTGKFRPLTYNHAQTAKSQNVIYGSKEEADAAKKAEEEQK